jgi:CRP-like cAMP-binding protein
MRQEAVSGRLEAVRAHPLAELLECPAEIGKTLNGSARSISFNAGEIIFRQSDACQGLYLVVSGELMRRAERNGTRLMLNSARTGDLVELAAALGDCHHTYTLGAISAGSLMMLPMEALAAAFQSYPPLRMRLLEELAREVSRAYTVCCLNRVMKTRRGNTAA